MTELEVLKEIANYLEWVLVVLVGIWSILLFK